MEKDQVRQITLVALSMMALTFGIYAAGHVAVSATSMHSPLRLATVAAPLLDEVFFWRKFVWTFAFATGFSAALFFMLANRYLPKTNRQPGDHGSAHWASEKEVKEVGFVCS